jgi:hypothetical protein
MGYFMETIDYKSQIHQLETENKKLLIEYKKVKKGGAALEKLSRDQDYYGGESEEEDEEKDREDAIFASVYRGSKGRTSSRSRCASTR